jgi:hypothetical protein
VRSDFGINLKYDFPYDIYIRTGMTLNYDNKPAEGSPELDYVLDSGIGWEW